MRSLLRHASLSLAAGLLCAAPAALAQPGATPTPGVPLAAEFDRADTDRDGVLSEDEAKKAGFFTQESFSDTDRNRDGTITLFELGESMQARFQSWIDKHAKADADGDGSVSREEADRDGATWSEMFDRADRDSDGRISREELMYRVTSTYYSEQAAPPMYPNIIEKRF